MECYPAAKTGGLADVVGSLPKYLNKLDFDVEVFIPKFGMKWFENKEYHYVHTADFYLHEENIRYGIAEVKGIELGFKLFVVDIPGKFDRNGVYSSEDGSFFRDEVQRHVCFQRSYLNYIVNAEFKPDVVHCHDHHTGLIPFMMQHCDGYRFLASTPVVFTIHNERYQGVFPWSMVYLLPQFDAWKSGVIDWANMINPLAAGVRGAWKVTTVSPTYMQELKYNSGGLENLFQSESNKCVGLLNGIDNDVWNPSTDKMLPHHLEGNIHAFKEENKKYLLENSQLDPSLPLLAFIGRFAGEKGADLLPEIIKECLNQNLPINFVVLGTGDKYVEHEAGLLSYYRPDKVMAHITFNESLSHLIYAAADFLIMPSRVEPCGLNQMYSMRYGTIPIVHNIGGLRDSVTYFDSEHGTGLKFENLYLYNIIQEIRKSIYLYNDRKLLDTIRKNCIEMDFSWDKSAHEYAKIYNSLL